jgi:GDPmannose 4,6-dehydratase
MAFKAIGIDVLWKGAGDKEQGFDAANGRELIRVNPRFHRPAEVELLIGDASKAQQKLGWRAEMSLEELCRTMVAADVERNERGASF